MTDASETESTPDTATRRIMRVVKNGVVCAAATAILVGGVIVCGQTVGETYKIKGERDAAYASRIASVYGAESAQLGVKEEGLSEKRVVTMTINGAGVECALPTSRQLDAKLPLRCENALLVDAL